MTGPCRVIGFLAAESAASTDSELTMRAGLDGTLVLRTKHTHAHTRNVQCSTL